MPIFVVAVKRGEEKKTVQRFFLLLFSPFFLYPKRNEKASRSLTSSQGRNEVIKAQQLRAGRPFAASFSSPLLSFCVGQDYTIRDGRAVIIRNPDEGERKEEERPFLIVTPQLTREEKIYEEESLGIIVTRFGAIPDHSSSSSAPKSGHAALEASALSCFALLSLFSWRS